MTRIEVLSRITSLDEKYRLFKLVCRSVQRLSSPERWELKQMMAANCIDKREMPLFDEETGVLPNDADDGEEIEVEIVEEEPAFLRGYGRATLDMDPVKIVKNPDGSLAQAAMMQGALSKERRELKQISRNKESGEQPKQVNIAYCSCL